MKNYLKFDYTKTFWGIMLVFTGLLSCLFLYNLFKFAELYKVVDSHKEVSVIVSDMKHIRSGKRDSYYLNFLYNGSSRSIRINNDFFDINKSKSTVRLLHLSDYENVFLPPNYKFGSELFYHSIITLLFIFVFYISLVRLYRELN